MSVCVRAGMMEEIHVVVFFSFFFFSVRYVFFHLKSQ